MLSTHFNDESFRAYQNLFNEVESADQNSLSEDEIELDGIHFLMS